MPELPEVESVRQALLPYLNETVTDVVVHDAWLRQPISGIFHKTARQKLLTIERMSKYLLLTFEGAPKLLVHLGMSGRLESRDHLLKHDKISWHFADGRTLYFNDARRFDWCSGRRHTACLSLAQSHSPTRLLLSISKPPCTNIVHRSKWHFWIKS